jgi:hypothetical protein
LVPPHCHHRNSAERALRTFKEHFVTGLYYVDPTFPLHLWDRLLPLAEITLNLLRTSRLHMQLVSWITTKQLLIRQDAKSSHTRNQESNALGHPTGNMDIIWVLQCIITDVKMYTSRPRPVNALWILSSSFHIIIRCHNYRPPTD